MKTFWQAINGNKTIICLAIVAILGKTIELGILEPTKYTELISWVFTALATGSFAHHVNKGYLGTEKGG